MGNTRKRKTRRSKSKNKTKSLNANKRKKADERKDTASKAKETFPAKQEDWRRENFVQYYKNKPRMPKQLAEAGYTQERLLT